MGWWRRGSCSRKVDVEDALFEDCHSHRRAAYGALFRPASLCDTPGLGRHWLALSSLRIIYTNISICGDIGIYSRTVDWFLGALRVRGRNRSAHAWQRLKDWIYCKASSYSCTLLHLLLSSWDRPGALQLLAYARQRWVDGFTRYRKQCISFIYIFITT